jgi:hypothetical protein
MTEKGKDIILGVIIAFFFTVLEMVITYMIVNRAAKKRAQNP